MKTAIFIPPLPRHSGGIAVLLNLGHHLSKAGFNVCFVVREDLSAISNDVPTVHWDEMKFDSNTIWLVPEGWPNALAPGFTARSHCLVYVQNWAFMLSALPQDTNWNQLPVRLLAVSDPVAWYIGKVTGQNASILRPGINTDLFHPADGAAQNQGKAVKGTLRVAWMPRKNKVLAKQIRQTAEAMMQVRNINAKLQWIEIDNRTQCEVADILRSAHIFVATGFPEGCPLPPLEAMASGCIVVGFSGMGGFDYMRQAASDAASFAPLCPLRATPWGGNGFYAADADVPSAAECLIEAVQSLVRGGPELAAIRQQAALTVSEYSLDKQAEAAVALWKTLV